MRRYSWPTLLAALLVSTAVHAEQWVVTRSEVRYTLRHPLHVVQGTSTNVEVVAVADASGIKVMARAAVASFDSESANRDAHMLEVVEAGRFPLVVLKGAAPATSRPTGPGKLTVPLAVEIDLHGEKVRGTITIEIEVVDSAHVVARFAFKESLTAHRVERPSLLFMKVDDDIDITGSIAMEARP